MEKSTFNIIVLATFLILISLLMAYEVALAEDNSSTFVMSCSIPEVPGLNAPLISQSKDTPPPEETTKEIILSEKQDARKP